MVVVEGVVAAVHAMPQRSAAALSALAACFMRRRRRGKSNRWFCSGGEDLAFLLPSARTVSHSVQRRCLEAISGGIHHQPSHPPPAARHH